MKSKITISVVVMTYNQENTINQTLDSILGQKGDFVLEVLIGEDHGTDKTRVLCEQYADKNKNIVLLPDESNMGIMRNFSRLMKACSGDFIAICSGDDYWCDEFKLQKQLSFFIAHPEVGVVSTSGYKLLVKQNKLIPNAVAPLQPYIDGDVKKFFFSPDYKGGVYALPLTLLIKKRIINQINFDEFVFNDFPVEDYPMQAIMSQCCKWGHIKDMTVVYRVYKESATFISVKHPKYLWYHKGLMNIRRYLNTLFPLDVCFDEEWMQDYEIYKEFLLYLHNLQYSKAKSLLLSATKSKAYNQHHYLKAKRIMTSRITFFIFYIYKEIMYYLDIKNRTE